jgi:purine-binding chemotaxis protein CheW
LEEFDIKAATEQAKARKPSRPPVPPQAHRHLRECLTFRLGAEAYGIDILKVPEIRGCEAPTRIANAPHDHTGLSKVELH